MSLRARTLPVLVGAVLATGLVAVPAANAAAPLPCVGGAFWKDMGTPDLNDDESWYRHCTSDGSKVLVSADIWAAGMALTVQKCVAPGEEFYIAKRPSVLREPSYMGETC
ncbi:hypothetical protein [Allokutzneria sp. NRRL B-24872]|uniref:hypothetical protein n=1 Tax=Allokutzneria sp. NRRL B-24872 TaxID=1137961 RepID=UPI000A37A49B|nr:hypothetical protein [Allokutzneria sp. NRRL B-24872]